MELCCDPLTSRPYETIVEPRGIRSRVTKLAGSEALEGAFLYAGCLVLAGVVLLSLYHSLADYSVTGTAVSVVGYLLP
jgi:hypothetical protein